MEKCDQGRIFIFACPHSKTFSQETLLDEVLSCTISNAVSGARVVHSVNLSRAIQRKVLRVHGRGELVVRLFFAIRIDEDAASLLG